MSDTAMEVHEWYSSGPRQRLQPGGESCCNGGDGDDQGKLVKAQGETKADNGK